MAMPPSSSVEIQDFPGLVNNIDPNDLQEGMAEEQVNACSVTMGELSGRLGYRAVTFDA